MSKPMEVFVPKGTVLVFKNGEPDETWEPVPNSYNVECFDEKGDKVLGRAYIKK
jgi:hypothetical protein